MINVCVTVVRRYDLLRQLLLSLPASTVPVDKVWIVNNGLSVEKLAGALDGFSIPTDTITPNKPMGLAWAMNYFIDHAPEERIISNDDITFAPYSIGELIRPAADIVWSDFGFSCFLLRDSCVEKIGKFDESISPQYTCFEDIDYLQRIDGFHTRAASVLAVTVRTGMKHVGSASMQYDTLEEQNDHHRRFNIAKENYLRKWNLAAWEH